MDGLEQERSQETLAHLRQQVVLDRLVAFDAQDVVLGDQRRQGFGQLRRSRELAELDDEAPWGAWGLASCAHFLNWRCGIGMNAAREKVRVAHALKDLLLRFPPDHRLEVAHEPIVGVDSEGLAAAVGDELDLDAEVGRLLEARTATLQEIFVD